MTRQEVTVKILCAMIRTREAQCSTKKQLVDNAIAYADMLERRLSEIPTDTQERSELGQSKDKKV